MEILKLYTQSVELSEVASNGNLRLRFILCDFEPNANGVALDRSTIEEWMGTIINQPVVGKIQANGKDFSGHEMKIRFKKDPETGEMEKEVIFDTSAVGTFYNVEIAKIDGKEYLIGDAEIWARFPTVIDIIKKRIASDEGLHTSWEILIKEKYQKDGIGVIKYGEFIGHCLLSKDTTPAYDCSRVLEAASVAEDDTLYEAIAQDVASQKEKIMSNTDVVLETIEVSTEPKAEPVEEPVVSETEPEVAEEQSTEGEGEVETSALTTNDIYRHLYDEVNRDRRRPLYLAFLFPEESYALFHDYEMDELEFVRVPYTVDGDHVIPGETEIVRLEVSVSEINDALAEKTEALVRANERIVNLERERDELLPFKEAAEKAAAEKAEAERLQKVADLRAYATKSGLISEDEAKEGGRTKIARMIANLDETGVKNLIADRLMEKLAAEPATSSASEPEPAIVNLTEDEGSHEEINPISVYINR